MAEQDNTGSAPEFTETENKAREQGWVPKDEWTGDGKWRDAEAFLDRGELFGKIDAQNREIKSTRQALQALQQHYSKVSETEYKRALETLKKEKKEALLDNDADGVLEADEKIAALREGVRQAPVQQSQTSNEPHPEFVAWLNKNSWYSSSSVMAAAADQLGRELAGQGKSPAEVLRDVEREIRKEFAHKFTNPNREKPGAVEGGGGSGGGKNERIQLSEVEEQVMKKLVGSGVLTKDQYIADIRKQRERQ